MKRSVILLVALLIVVSGAYAQRDDMYYRPSKKDKVDEAANTSEKAANSNSINYSTTYDDYDGYTDDEIDAYNRRYDMYGDTLYLGDGEGDSQSSYDGEYEQEYYNNDYECTARIIRFHSPSISIYYGFVRPVVLRRILGLELELGLALSVLRLGLVSPPVALLGVGLSPALSSRALRMSRKRRTLFCRQCAQQPHRLGRRQNLDKRAQLPRYEFGKLISRHAPQLHIQEQSFVRHKQQELECKVVRKPQ